MEGVAPPLRCLIEIHSSLANGEPARKGIARYLHRPDRGDTLAPLLRRFVFAWEQGHDWRALIEEPRGTLFNGAERALSPQRRALLELIAQSLAGQPILSHLEELRAEIVSACEHEIAEHLELLPIKMLLPLLLFHFPAFLILLFGPLLTKLVEELNR